MNFQEIFAMEDKGIYEKLSIRDSARSLKKYGSTSKHIMKNENYIKHVIASTDTLQGIALKYGVTMEQIRRANRLWASDSLFLREHLLIPTTDNVLSPTVEVSSIASTPSTSQFSPDNCEDVDVNEFLGKIDASIANTKEEVKKAQGNSEFAVNLEFAMERKKPAISRMKKSMNNNSTTDVFPTPQAVVMTQGNKIKTSMRKYEHQQDELFEL